MNNPEIIFFDIDDTLYRKYTDTLRPSVSQAMHELKAKGILTAIATGRPEAAMPAKVKALIQECGIDMLVTINGQYISFQGEPLQSYPLDIANIETAINLLEQHKIDYAFVNNQEIAVSSHSLRVVEGLSHILPNFLTDKEYFRKQPVYQMLVFVDEEEEKILQPLIQQHGFKSVRWHKHAMDLLKQEGSKARGIAHAVEKLGIDMSKVMAFGDSFNDLEMLSTVGFGVAMGNGEDAAKSAAQFVCPSVDEDGVLLGLQELGVI